MRLKTVLLGALFLSVCPLFAASGFALDCNDLTGKDSDMPFKPRRNEFQLDRVLLRFKAKELVKSVAVAGRPSQLIQEMNMVPRGSAVLTSSGNLKDKKIEAIIHAASGSLTADGGEFEPTLQSISDSVKNSIHLARTHGFKALAIPFIGGRIFSQRVGVAPSEIARAIVESALSAISEKGPKITIKFVTFGAEDTALFASIVEEKGASIPVLNGSITDYNVHHCRAIVNAANMELMFGGGLSGIIAHETDAADQIEGEAWDKIAAYYLTTE